MFRASNTTILKRKLHHHHLELPKCRAIKFRLTFIFPLQSMPSVHPKCYEYRVEPLPVRFSRWCWTWYFDGQSNDSRAKYSSLWKRQSCYRCWESHGGNGGNDSLAWNLAERNTVLRWRAICYAMPNSAGKYFQVRARIKSLFTLHTKYPMIPFHEVPGPL